MISSQYLVGLNNFNLHSTIARLGLGSIVIFLTHSLLWSTMLPAMGIDWVARDKEFIDKIQTLLAERHHFRLPVAERVKRFVGIAAGASASKALTASATRKRAFVALAN